jgi:peptidyl-prolyl cis-trans isomerase SurA
VRARIPPAALAVLLLGGCAVPSWVPWLGKTKPESPAAVPAAGLPVAPALPPVTVSTPSAPPAVPPTDRIVAVVNNDAITLSELQEAIAVYRHENRLAGGEPPEELVQQFLNRMIDNRLQLQEAEREKIAVDDAEVEEEMGERMKRLQITDRSQFETLLKAQGLTMEAVKKRVRDSIRLARVVRRKVTLRVSVTEAEISRYLEENRQKLETGLAYHAQHILVLPEGSDPDKAWEEARIRAEVIRAAVLNGGDFTELARKHSKDASAKDGGDLGVLKRGELAQDIEEQILALAPGQVSAPYRSQIGWHVFRLESKEALEGDTLARAKQQIRDILFRQKYEVRLDAWLKEIKQRAIIDVRL